jgi:hypothetical protein
MLKDIVNINYKPFYKDNKLYSFELNIKINNKYYKIIIKDSYLLLNNSLIKLGNDYKVNVIK